MATGSEIRSPSGPCGWCVKAVKWVPVLFILTIVGWSYYAYVVQLCIIIVPSTFEMIAYLLGYHLVFITFMWSYWQTVFTPIGTVPRKFKLPKEDLEKMRRADTEEAQRVIIERFAQSLPVTNRTITGAVRYCEKCCHIKPDRAHHCSVCGECVLKMDHHCPWVNNCVSFTNYKFFILFLGYALIYCLFVALTSLKYFIQFWQVWQGDLEGMGRFHILFLFFVAAMFAVSLVSLFCYHCYLVIHNRSTLEAFRAPIFRSGADKDGFSLGKYNNFQEVFGDNQACWFLPVFTSLGDGVTFPQRSVDEDTDHLLGSRQRWCEEESPSHRGMLPDSDGTTDGEGARSSLMQVI